MHTRPGYHRRVCDRFSFQNISLERSGHNPREVSLCTETVHHSLCRHSPRNRLHSPHWQKSKLSTPRSSSSNRRRQRLGKPAWNRAQWKKARRSRDLSTFHGLSSQPWNRSTIERVQVYYSGRTLNVWLRKVSDFKREHRKLTSRPSDQGVARCCFLTCFAHQDLLSFRVENSVDFIFWIN